MGKNKLSKFAEMETFSNVLQVSDYRAEEHDYQLKGCWNSDFFGNDNPIILELGCGKGEYTVGLAKLFPNANYIGIDIKGSRMWNGAKQALDEGLTNVCFLRTHIEMIDRFFGSNEISEIWLTFPDPQMAKVRKRLTSTRFINLYREFLKPGGIIHLKTDSNFQYQYTLEMALKNEFQIIDNFVDVYSNGLVEPSLQIKTYYEQQWIARDITIKYLSFIPHEKELLEPDTNIEFDTYRSFGRGTVLANL